MLPILETTRLILRQFDKDDIPRVHNYAGDYETVKYTLWGPNTDADTASFIFYAINEANRPQIRDYQFAVIDKATKELIGGCGVKLDKNTNSASLGWVLGKEHWNNGLGTEICAELIRFSFAELNLRRVIAACDAENIASYRIMEKNGMRREGYFKEVRQSIALGGVWRDELFYALLKSEWNK